MKTKLKNLLLMLALSLTFVISAYKVNCDEASKTVNLGKDYTYCTFTVTGENLSNCTGSVISPNGGSYALSNIDGYLVTTIDKVQKGEWTIKVVSSETVPDFSVSISANNLVSQGNQNIVDTTVAKKVTNLSAYMEDETIIVNWAKGDNETVLVQFIDADTNEQLEYAQNSDGTAKFKMPQNSNKVIVKCVYYSYREYDNAYTSYIFDRAEVPTAEISFNCKEKTNLNTIECSVNTVYKYSIYNNGNAVKNSIPLVEGDNHIVLKVTSDKGYIKNYEYEIFKDTKPPVISLNEDISRLQTEYEQLQISGTVTDAVTLMVQGSYVNFNDEGSFDALLTFDMGSNEIVIRATDDTGNVTEYIAYVTRYEVQKGIPTSLIVLIGAVIIIIGVIVIGRRQFKKNLSEELSKRDSELSSVKKDLEGERYKATHDELTDCKNRTGYMNDLSEVNINDICIINFDVNNLKWTNDNLGHQSGDKLLLTISNLLKEKFKNVYRMGGDEFTVITDKYSFDEDVLKEIDIYLEEKTKVDPDKVIYQVAYGYDFGDGVKTEKEIYFNADQLMYADKKEKKKKLADSKEDLEKSGFSLEQIDNLLKKYDNKNSAEAVKKERKTYFKEAETVETVETKKSNPVLPIILSAIPYVFALVIVAIILFKVVFFGVIQSESMSPTMKTGDIIIGSRLYYEFNDYNRGDMVSFEMDGEIHGKRIVGIEGDAITFKNGYVVLNGEVLYEEYLDEDIETNDVDTYEVPTDTLFLLGDNRENSVDSRYWDNPYLPTENILGKVLIVIPSKYAVPIKFSLLGLGTVILLILIISLFTSKKEEW